MRHIGKCLAPRRYVLDHQDWIKNPLDRLWIFRGYRTTLSEELLTYCTRCKRQKVFLKSGTIYFDRPPKEKIQMFHLGQCKRCQMCFWTLTLGERMLAPGETAGPE